MAFPLLRRRYAEVRDFAQRRLLSHTPLAISLG